MAEQTVSYRAKSVVVSKTVWFNIITAAVAFLGSDQLKVMLGPRALEIVAMAVTIANVVLRYFTVRPVAMIAPKDSIPVAVPKLD